MQFTVALLGSRSGVNQVSHRFELASIFGLLLEGFQDLDLRVVLGLTKLCNHLFLELSLHSMK